MMEGSRLTADVELALIQRAQAGDRDAVGLLLQDLLPYIKSMAAKWHFRKPRDSSLDDCRQVAGMGAMRAIAKFDLASGNRLITYATYWIWQHLGRMRLQRDVVVRPILVNDRRKTISLDKHVWNEGRPTTEAALVESRDDSVLRVVARREAIERVAPLLEVLTQRDREILLLRQSLSLTEVAAQVGLSSERVRQIEAQSLHRVKIEADRLGYADDDGRERTTVTVYSCPHCQSSDTRTIGDDPRKWKCEACGRKYVPDEMRINKSNAKSPSAVAKITTAMNSRRRH